MRSYCFLYTLKDAGSRVMEYSATASLELKFVNYVYKGFLQQILRFRFYILRLIEQNTEVTVKI